MHRINPPEGYCFLVVSLCIELTVLGVTGSMKYPCA